VNPPVWGVLSVSYAPDPAPGPTTEGEGHLEKLTCAAVTPWRPATRSRSLFCRFGAARSPAEGRRKSVDLAIGPERASGLSGDSR